MSISGNLATMELAELLQWAAQSAKTGMLLIQNDQVEKKVYFLGGKIVATASDDPSEQLSHYLVGQGLLTEEQLAVAMKMQADSGDSLGRALVALEMLPEKDLQQILLTLCHESVFDMFSWREGDFRFVEGEGLEANLVPMSLEVTALILKGMERVDEWRRIREYITSPRDIPVAVGPLTDEYLSPGELRILELVNDDRSIEEICDETHSSEFAVCKVLFPFIEASRLKVVHPRSEPGLEPGASIGPEVLIGIATELIEKGLYLRALRNLRAARSLDPSGEATRNSIGEAEARVARELREVGLKPKAVPRVALDENELEELPLSPEESFVLSQINGSHPIESILRISPMPPLEAQLVFHKLLQAGLIEISSDGR